VADADRGEVGRWVRGVWGRDDPEEGGGEASLAAWASFAGYVAGLREQKRRHPADDIATVLVDAELDGDRLTDNEYRSLFVELTVAGFETTNSLIAQGMRALLAHPDAGSALRHDPSAVRGAVEEMLRYVTPFVHIARTATGDVEIGGQRVRVGEVVTIWLPATNRDPAVFPDPHRFDIARDPNPHQAFNPGGHHFCLGAHLARMESRVAFEELLAGPALEAAGEPSHLRSTMVQALKRLPVRVVRGSG
jgi:methyl-branched lipid omega-hydroxylase